MRVSDIKYNRDEKIISNTEEHVRVEVKRLGPTIKVLTKCKIIVTNQRIIITQKLLFRNKYIVVFIIWLNKTNTEKYTLTNLMITDITKDKITEIEIKGRKVTELTFDTSSIEYIRIFTSKKTLFK